MPEIMRQYGQTILVAVAGMLLCALLFVSWPSGGNVLSDIGSRSATQIENTGQTANGAATQRFDERAGRTRPQARLLGTVTERTPVALVDLFEITDADGATWSSTAQTFLKNGSGMGGSVEVLSLTASNTPDVNLINDTTVYDRTSGQATFPNPGVYRVRLRILDHDNVEAVYAFNLAVDIETKG